MSLAIEWRCERPDNLLVGRRLVGHGGEFVCYRPAGDRQTVAVQEAGIEQQLQNLGNAAGRVEIDSHIAAGWLEIADYWYPTAYPLEILQRPFHLGRMSRYCDPLWFSYSALGLS